MQIALAALPATAFLLVCALLSLSLSDWRRSVLAAAVTCGALVAASTEILSLFQAFTGFWITVFWAATCVVLAVVLWRQRSSLRVSLKWHVPAGSSVLLIGVGLIAAIAAVIAVASPPNNWDSMTYHLPRVEHWLQNQTVANYPTAILRQLYQHPGAEYVIAHFRALTGTDTFSNLVQWFGMIGSLVGVSAIVRLWRTRVRGQVLAVVFVATLAMGIMQSMTTQNDYVIAFWLVTVAYFTIESIEQGFSWLRTVLIGLALGLTVLTKGTSYLYALPFVLYFAVEALRRLHWKALRYGLVAGGLALSLTLPFFIRTTLSFGTPWGGEQSIYSNAVLSFPVVASNFIRNTAMQLTPPAGWLNDRFRLTERVNRAVVDLHNVIGMDVSDPATTWPGQQFGVSVLDFDEDAITNPVHLLLIAVAGTLYFIFYRRTRHHTVTGYFVCILASAVLFSIVLRWQPWHSRLQLPLFVLAGPFVAYVFDRLVDYRLNYVLGAGLVVFGLWTVPQAKFRALVGEHTLLNTDRQSLQFLERRDYRAPFEEVVQRVSELGCHEVGLSIGGDTWEYPLWVLFRDAGWPVQLNHVVNNQAAVAEVPCAVIRVERNATNLTIGEVDFAVAWESGPVALLLPPAT